MAAGTSGVLQIMGQMAPTIHLHHKELWKCYDFMTNSIVVKVAELASKVRHLTGSHISRTFGGSCKEYYTPPPTPQPPTANPTPIPGSSILYTKNSV